MRLIKQPKRLSQYSLLLSKESIPITPLQVSSFPIPDSHIQKETNHNLFIIYVSIPLPHYIYQLMHVVMAQNSLLV